MAKKRGRRSSKKPEKPLPEHEEPDNIPKSFIFKSSAVSLPVRELIQDVRKVMSPNTAKRLKENKKNKLKDFLQVAGQFGVTHFMMFTQTELGPYLRMARVPRGPTLTFKILSYTLCKDIARFQKGSGLSNEDLMVAPTLVLNNFGENTKSVQLAASMFQNMFPPINVHDSTAMDIHRVVLLNYNSETQTVDFRHYRVNIKHTGISKSIKALVSTNIPKLSGFNDIGDVVIREAIAAESDVEDGPQNTLELSEGMVGPKKKAGVRAVKLVEVGPRMELQLLKVENGLCGGEVLYHKYIKLSEEEIKKQRKEFEERKAETQRRKAQQELNVKKKKDAAEAHRIACGAAPKEQSQENPGENEAMQEDEEDEEEDNYLNDYTKETIPGFDVDEDLFEDDHKEKDLSDEESENKKPRASAHKKQRK